MAVKTMYNYNRFRRIFYAQHRPEEEGKVQKEKGRFKEKTVFIDLSGGNSKSPWIT